MSDENGILALLNRMSAVRCAMLTFWNQSFDGDSTAVAAAIDCCGTPYLSAHSDVMRLPPSYQIGLTLCMILGERSKTCVMFSEKRWIAACAASFVGIPLRNAMPGYPPSRPTLC